MVQSKAIDVLKQFSRKEFLQFGKYIEANVFTSNKNLARLYDFIKKYYPDFSAPKLTKENIFKSVYGGQSYSDTKARKLLSDLYKEAEKFIVIQYSLSQKTIYNKILLDELDTRNLDSLFSSTYEELNEYLDKGEKHYEYFMEKYLLEWRNIMFHLERGMQHKIALDVYKRTEYLIFLFLSDLYLSLNDIDSNKSAFNIESSVNLAGEFISCLNDKKLFEFIDKNDFENKDIVCLYYLGYHALRDFEDESKYYSLKEFVQRNLHKFHEGSKRTAVISLINYCVRKLRQSENIKFQHELYESYNLFIKYKLYKLSGENYIRSDLFLNILLNTLSVGKTAEVKKFLEDNIESIQPSHRKNMLSISNALINFEKGSFGESLRDASRIKSNTFLYKDRIKILILKNNYELKNYEIAKELSNSYKIYITESTHATEQSKAKRLRFLYYYNILWRYYENKPVKQSLKELKKEILSSESFTESGWILRKIDELDHGTNMRKSA